ncbi:MAG: PAAR domain-containing protein [Actinomycetota bacterium]
MGQPAVVMGDRVMGTCPVHQVPAPSGTAPVSNLPFQGPLLQGLTTTVMIGGKPAAVAGSSGINTPPHVGLHAADPAMAPTAQQAQVVSGSATVFFDGKPAAYTGCQVTHCVPPVPGQVSGSATTVMVGG